MGLSDACYEFLTEARATQSSADRKLTAVKLAENIAYYSASPFAYGDELETLAYVCGDFIGGRSVGNDDPWERLLFLADAIREGLDSPPPSGRGTPSQ